MDSSAEVFVNRPFVSMNSDRAILPLVVFVAQTFGPGPLMFRLLLNVIFWYCVWQKIWPAILGQAGATVKAPEGGWGFEPGDCKTLTIPAMFPSLRVWARCVPKALRKPSRVCPWTEHCGRGVVQFSFLMDWLTFSHGTGMITCRTGCNDDYECITGGCITNP
jgi:hypothetical protein